MMLLWNLNPRREHCNGTRCKRLIEAEVLADHHQDLRKLGLSPSVVAGVALNLVLCRDDAGKYRTETIFTLATSVTSASTYLVLIVPSDTKC